MPSEMTRSGLINEIKSAASKNIKFNIGYQTCKDFPHWSKLSIEAIKQCAEAYALLGFKDHNIKYLGMAQALADIIRERQEVSNEQQNNH